MEQFLIDRLLATAGLIDLVGNRIDWLKRPQAAALPAIVLQEVSAPYTYTMKGRTKLVGRLVQMDVWSGTYPSMRAVSAALVAALNGPHSAPFQGIFIENESDSYEAQIGPDGSASTEYYRNRFDVRVWSDDAA